MAERGFGVIMSEVPKSVTHALMDTPRGDNEIKLGIGKGQSVDGGPEEYFILMETRLGSLLFDAEEAEGIVYAMKNLIQRLRIGFYNHETVQ